MSEVGRRHTFGFEDNVTEGEGEGKGGSKGKGKGKGKGTGKGKGKGEGNGKEGFIALRFKRKDKTVAKARAREIFKSEPDEFCITFRIEARPSRTLDGIRNFEAAKMLRDEFKIGDSNFYHSSCKDWALLVR